MKIDGLKMTIGISVSEPQYVNLVTDPPSKRKMIPIRPLERYPGPTTGLEPIRNTDRN